MLGSTAATGPGLLARPGHQALSISTAARDGRAGQDLGEASTETQDQQGLDSRWEGGLRRGTPSKGGTEDICPGPSPECLGSLLCNSDPGPASRQLAIQAKAACLVLETQAEDPPEVWAVPVWASDYRRSWLYENVSSCTIRVSIYLTYISYFRFLIKSYFNIGRVWLSLETVTSLNAVRDWGTGRSAEDPVSSGIAASMRPREQELPSAWSWQQGEKRQPPPTAGASPLLKAPITPTLLHGDIWSRS